MENPELTLKMISKETHQSVVTQLENRYIQRKLDAEGQWRINHGRKLKTEREMLVRDYSKSTLFQNPLNPSH